MAVILKFISNQFIQIGEKRFFLPVIDAIIMNGTPFLPGKNNIIPISFVNKFPVPSGPLDVPAPFTRKAEMVELFFGNTRLDLVLYFTTDTKLMKFKSNGDPGQVEQNKNKKKDTGDHSHEHKSIYYIYSVLVCELEELGHSYHDIITGLTDIRIR